jgi:hypothetical protein
MASLNIIELGLLSAIIQIIEYWSQIDLADL